MHDALSAADMVTDELVQLEQTGHDVAEARERLAELGTDAPPEQLWRFLDELADIPQRSDWPYDEPTDPADILAALPPAPAPTPTPASDVLQDKVLGAWQGRIAGCNLGKPVEYGDHWTRAHIKAYLTGVDAYPLLDYIPKADEVPPEYMFRENWPLTTRGRVHGSARDDDIDYAILALHFLEKYGREYTAEDVAQEWLALLPFLQVYTAERVAMRNLIHGQVPPRTATWRNPYREWIGAQIRADVHGYVNPGDPRAAALSSMADASLSHVANGIYGEMWSAALCASAFVAPDARTAIVASLDHIPPKSRLREVLDDVLAWHGQGLQWEAAIDRLDAKYGHYHWVHTINNAGAVAAGLLWADGDFSAAIGLTVQAGMDTDSNGATAGSVAGILAGARSIPSHWVEPLDNRVATAVFGYDNVHISDLARRTIEFVSAH